MPKEKTKHQVQQYLSIAAISILLGKAMQHIWGIVPYTGILWDEEYLGDFVSDWDYFVNDVWTDRVVDSISYSIAAFFILLAIGIFLKKERFMKTGIIIGTIILSMMSILSFKDKFYQFPQLLEYAILCSSLMFYYLHNRIDDSKYILSLKIAISSTFIGHGLYALGLYHVPVHFMEMTMGILYLDENSAQLFLQIAGYLDILVAILIWTKGKWLNFALGYMIVWGLITALARLVYPLLLGWESNAFIMGFFAMLYRLCHGILPLVLKFKLKD